MSKWQDSQPSAYSTRRKNARDVKLDYFAHVVTDSHRLSASARLTLLDSLPPGLRRLLDQVDQAGEIDASSEARLDWGGIATNEAPGASRSSAGSRLPRTVQPVADHGWVNTTPHIVV